MVGSLFDLADMDETDSALGAISSAVQVGRTELLAVVLEQSPEAVDAAMSGVGGTVLRRPVAEVERRDRSRGGGRAHSKAGSSQSAAPGTPRARQGSRQCNDR